MVKSVVHIYMLYMLFKHRNFLYGRECCKIILWKTKFSIISTCVGSASNEELYGIEILHLLNVDSCYGGNNNDDEINNMFTVFTQFERF